jgi:hypothetical protein
MKTHAPAPPSNLVWPDEELKVPDEFSGPAWEIVEENYAIFPFVVEDEVSSVVWLHSYGRRKYNAFQQKNLSKAWTTDARAGGNSVDVAKLTTCFIALSRMGIGLKQLLLRMVIS